MLEFIVVDHPTVAPWACVATGDSNGPMVDTHRELVGHGRIYLSKSATIRAARAFGLLKGNKKHEELLHAAATLDEREQEIRKLEETGQSQADELAANKRTIETLTDALDRADGRIAQLEGAIREDAEARLAIAGAK